MGSISIITINLNNCCGLYETIKSVICQTNENFEFIIIDGGSTDGSLHLINSYQDNINYWISEPDNGIYDAMNKGIKIATCDYCLFLNSGDFLVNKDVLMKCSNLQFNHDIVSCNTRISKDKKMVGYFRSPNEVTLKTLYISSLPHQATLIRRELFSKIGMYSTEYKIHSDLNFFLKSFLTYETTYQHLDITLSDYNLNGRSSDNRNFDSNSKERELVLKRIVNGAIHKDYMQWAQEKQKYKQMEWFYSKPILHFFVVFAYNVAYLLTHIRRT